MLSPEDFDAEVEKFNSSVKLLRSCAASQEVREFLTSLSKAPGLDAKGDIVLDTKKAMFEAMTKIQLQVTGPRDFFQRMTINYQHLACIRWLLQFDIPGRVPLDSRISYASLATAADVPQSQLRQITRMAMTSGLFREIEPNTVSHTTLSASFVKEPALRETWLYMTETEAPAAMNMFEMTSRFRGSEKPNETAYNIAMNTNLPFSEYLVTTPVTEKRQQATMKTFGRYSCPISTDMKHLLEAYDWAGLGDGHVVEIASSTGYNSNALARAIPRLHFIVQCVSSVLGVAKSTPLPDGVADRITFIAQGPFLLQPFSSANADVFLLSQVIQNYSNTSAQRILRNIAAVMKPDAVILLNNQMLPKPGSVGARSEAFLRARSLTLFQTMNGEDRDEEGFRELVEGAKCGLKVREIKKGPGFLDLIVVEKVRATVTGRKR